MSDKITFKELVELIARQSKQSESSANSFIHELVQIVESGLKKSGSVSISGFGKFELRWMKERPGVNPQTGDEITIPGQNKVVFKPYKALRETVNKPFANLEPEILPKKTETKEPESAEENEIEDSDPFGLEGVFGSDDPFQDADDDLFDSEAPFDADDPFDSETPFDADDPFEEDDDIFGSEDPFIGDPFKDPEPSKEPVSRKEDQSIDDLIIERENPHFRKKQTEAFIEEDDDVLVLEKEEEEEEKADSEQRPNVAPIIPDESKMAKEVQDSGSFRWSYAAAVIIVMIALILLFWLMQRSNESLQETAVTGDQTEQVIEEPSAADEAAEGETAAEEPQPTVDEESPPATGGAPPDELETETYTVESGQTLWDIAESQMGNPYLWPVIYHLNQDVFDNPNQLLANSDIEIPTFSDPDNLNEFQREQVALGYFSLYEWSRENNSEEARYFLWAVGVFSQDLLDQPPSEVDQQDLAFARNR